LSIFVENKIIASGIAAAVTAILNIPALVTSYTLNRKVADTENISSFWRAFLFIVHPRSSVLELLWLIVLTPAYAFLMTYKMDWGMFYMAIFSSYSMLGEPIPEITPYLTDKDFHLLSH